MKLKAVAFSDLRGGVAMRIEQAYRSLSRAVAAIRGVMNINHERSASRIRSWMSL